MCRHELDDHNPRSPGAYHAIVKKFATDSGVPCLHGPVELSIYITRKIPKSWSKKKKEAAWGQPVDATPDGVNVSALIHDGLKGVAYDDDKQVSDQRTVRRWGGGDEVTIIIKDLNAEPAPLTAPSVPQV